MLYTTSSINVVPVFPIHIYISLQEALELERTTKDEVTAQLSEVQSQLQQSEKARQTEAVEKRQMKVKLVDCQRELERVMRAEETSGEREAELDRVQALLQSLEADNREQVYTSCHSFSYIFSNLLLLRP